eukprot:3576463-Rhodomonas_salina.1
MAKAACGKYLVPRLFLPRSLVTPKAPFQSFHLTEMATTTALALAESGPNLDEVVEHDGDDDRERGPRDDEDEGDEEEGGARLDLVLLAQPKRVSVQDPSTSASKNSGKTTRRKRQKGNAPVEVAVVSAV